MEMPETYRQRAEDAERKAEMAHDPEAARILRSAARRWWGLADLVERRERKDRLNGANLDH